MRSAPEGPIEEALQTPAPAGGSREGPGEAPGPCSLLAIAAIAAIALAGCGLDPEDPDVDRFELSWSLARDGAAVTCGEAGASRVVIRSVLLGSGACPVERTDRVCLLVDAVACEAESAVTHALPAGELSVTLEAVDAEGAALGASPARVAELRGNGRIVALEPFAIDVTGR